MFLERLSVLNFKNHEDSSLELSNNINCFVGNNGQVRRICLMLFTICVLLKAISIVKIL